MVMHFATLSRLSIPTFKNRNQEGKNMEKPRKTRLPTGDVQLAAHKMNEGSAVGQFSHFPSIRRPASDFKKRIQKCKFQLIKRQSHVHTLSVAAPPANFHREVARQPEGFSLSKLPLGEHARRKSQQVVTQKLEESVRDSHICFVGAKN